jgi:glycosyltransferase involved in cell wall biosynthesis
MQPDVSIIIPVFNRPRLVEEAIASALDPAASARREVIVVDDASTDETWDVVRAMEPRIRALRQPRNAGHCAAINAGLQVARGAYIKFLDSDDLLVAAHLDEELQACRAASADIAVSGWGEVFADGRRRELPAPAFDSIVDDVLAGRAVTNAAALYLRKPDLRWDPTLPKLADWDVFVQAALGANRIVTTPGISFWIRHHGGTRVTTSASMLTNARAHHHILRKIEDRLAADGRLTPARRLRLAQYYYKELRVLSLHDRDAFEAAWAHIRELDPRFAPRDEERQWWMRVAARVLGTRRALLTHSALKRRLGRSR